SRGGDPAGRWPCRRLRLCPRRHEKGGDAEGEARDELLQLRLGFAGSEGLPRRQEADVGEEGLGEKVDEEGDAEEGLTGGRGFAARHPLPVAGEGPQPSRGQWTAPSWVTAPRWAGAT